MNLQQIQSNSWNNNIRCIAYYSINSFKQQALTRAAFIDDRDFMEHSLKQFVAKDDVCFKKPGIKMKMASSCWVLSWWPRYDEADRESNSDPRWTCRKLILLDFHQKRTLRDLAHRYHCQKDLTMTSLGLPTWYAKQAMRAESISDISSPEDGWQQNQLGQTWFHLPPFVCCAALRDLETASRASEDSRK